MTLEVFIPATVDLHILQIDLWWRTNRLEAPDLFEEELTALLALLAERPNLGKVYRSSRFEGTRRVLLRTTRFHVYYIVDGDVLSVLAVWGAVKGHGPDLGEPHGSA